MQDICLYLFAVINCLGMHQLLCMRFALCGLKHATSVHRAAQYATTVAESSCLCLIKYASRHVETFVAERIFKLGRKSKSCLATVIMYTTQIVWRHGSKRTTHAPCVVSSCPLMTWRTRQRRSVIKEKLKRAKELQMLFHTLTFCTLRPSFQQQIPSLCLLIHSKFCRNCLILHVCICVDSSKLLETYKRSTTLKTLIQDFGASDPIS